MNFWTLVHPILSAIYLMLKVELLNIRITRYQLSFPEEMSLKDLCGGIPLDPLPPRRDRDENLPHAPVLTPNLSDQEERVSVMLDLVGSSRQSLRQVL